jgi:nitric oxide reductase activation protein
VNLMADRGRWAVILGAVAAAYRWEISGGRGVVRRIVVMEPPDVDRINIAIRVASLSGRPEHPEGGSG